MTLAVQLRNSSEQRRAYQKRREQEAIIEDNANARRIVQEMTRTALPEFLAGLAQQSRRRAYLVGLYVYKPRQWSVDLPRHAPLSLEMCCQELVGVPLHLARWAIAQKLRVYLQNHHNFPPEERFVWKGREPQERGEGSTGLCVSW